MNKDSGSVCVHAQKKMITVVAKSFVPVFLN